MFLQYQTWQRLVGNKLIAAPVSFKSNERILEVATGAGTSSHEHASCNIPPIFSNIMVEIGFWMLDFAVTVPKSVTLHGIDRSSRHFPKQHPENVSFSTCAATALPFSWQDYFDFVHQRFLSLSLTLYEWKAAVAEVHRVLKPGAWVQIGEVYPAFPSGEYGSKQKALFYAMSQSRGLDLDIPLHLSEHLSSIGFVNVSVEENVGECGSEHGSHGNGNKGRMLAVTKSMKSEVIRAGGFGIVNSKKEFDELVKGLEKEYDQGESRIRFFTCIAQKPLPVERP